MKIYFKVSSIIISSNMFQRYSAWKGFYPLKLERLIYSFVLNIIGSKGQNYRVSVPARTDSLLWLRLRLECCDTTVATAAVTILRIFNDHVLPLLLPGSTSQKGRGGMSGRRKYSMQKYTAVAEEGSSRLLTPSSQTVANLNICKTYQSATHCCSQLLTQQRVVAGSQEHKKYVYVTFTAHSFQTIQLLQTLSRWLVLVRHYTWSFNI